MKGKPLLIMAFMLLLLVSCEKKESETSLTFDNDTKQLVFFSDKEKYEQEVSYYDAIIELKKDYPEEIKNMKVLTVSEMNNYSDTFQVDHCPTLLVYYQNKVIIEIHGDVETEEIVEPLAKELAQNSETHTPY